MTENLSSPEHKASAIGTDLSAAFGEFMQAFEAFKDTNDRRLAEIERRGADVVTTDKLDRIDAALDQTRRQVDQLALKAARPRLGAGPREVALGVDLDHKAAFEAYVRHGQDSTLKRLEEKALSVGSGADGGYLVPSNVEDQIGRRLSNASPIRALAGSMTVSTSVYKKPFSKTGPVTGWAAETAARNTTNSPVLAEIAFPTMELYAMPAATGALLDDAAVDIDQWIADEVQFAFAEQEGTAFVNGDGISKPTGFLTPPKIAESSWTWDKIGYKATGTAGAFPAANPSDVLFDLVYTLKGGYRQNGTFVMNRNTQSVIRKFRDSTGAYLWAPPSVPGGQATLLNFPLVEAEDMPAIGTDSYSVAFGDFRRGYLIVDRAGVRILRDLYSAKPYVLFYTTKRVGGGVQDFDAIKLLKFGTT